MSVTDPIMLINNVPVIPAMAKVEVKNPRIFGSEISPIYIGKAVYNAPSAAPITKRMLVIVQMLLANAIPTNERHTTGATASVVHFLPILSANIAAIMAPGGAPSKGATAHQDPSSLVVGISDVFDLSFGKYGDVQPKFIPELTTENAPIAKNWVNFPLKYFKILLYYQQLWPDIEINFHTLLGMGIAFLLVIFRTALVI